MATVVQRSFTDNDVALVTVVLGSASATDRFVDTDLLADWALRSL